METLTAQERKSLYLIKQRTRIYRRMIILTILSLGFAMLLLIHQSKIIPLGVILVSGIMCLIFICYTFLVMFARCPRCKKYFYGGTLDSTLHQFRWAKSYASMECFYCHLKDESD